MRLLAEISFRGLFYFLTDKYYRKFIGLVFRYGDQKRHRPFQTKLYGYNWAVADALSFIWQFKEIFADQSYRFETKSAQPIIVDCGSNIGLSCLYYHLHYPNAQIICYEPDPEISKVLQKNLNGLQNPRIQLIQKAVWTENGELSFFQHDVDSGSVINSGLGKEVRVACVDLLKELKQHDHIDFLKMDVEGAEFALIPHIVPALGRIQNLFIEYHSFPGQEQSLSTILNCLEQAGFRYFLKTENRRKTPLINQQTDKAMDYQTNIYAFRP